MNPIEKALAQADKIIAANRWLEQASERPSCNVLFCSLDQHDGDEHSDVTGHSWTEPTPDVPVIARAYSLDGSPPVDLT